MRVPLRKGAEHDLHAADEQSDEAQAAMLLEAAGGDFADASYEEDDFVVTQESGLNVLQVTALLQRLFAMRLEGRTPQAISMRFHAAFSANTPPGRTPNLLAAPVLALRIHLPRRRPVPQS